jgi:hypothetical protein
MITQVLLLVVLFSFFMTHSMGYATLAFKQPGGYLHFRAWFTKKEKALLEQRKIKL